jgi:hypothetical protein
MLHAEVTVAAQHVEQSIVGRGLQGFRFVVDDEVDVHDDLSMAKKPVSE